LLILISLFVVLLIGAGWLARRMVERGVRFVQLYHSTWDDHSDLNEHLKTNCDMTDKPTAALLRDLKQRGLLESTLVIWAGEFGRTPMNEVRRGNTPGKEGRDHHRFAYTLWLSGGGISRLRSLCTEASQTSACS